jgi:butyryl-CoA dehydrogenase
MPTYKAPLRDMRFVIHELLTAENGFERCGFEDLDTDVIDAVLDEAAKLCEQVLQPLNRTGDEAGCSYENGVVRTPEGFREAYTAFAEGGWTGLAAMVEHGGQGLPHLVGQQVSEMLCSANLSFSMYPSLSHGAYLAIARHGDDALKQAYLPALVDGRWSGTMCLTEPHCGTDLGLVRTRAEPAEDGSYRLTGTKIFISAGEHDLTENIVHLVLARVRGAPEGIKGLSLFVVPRNLPRLNGELGPCNGVRCAGIEDKMGIHGSATCVLEFEDATGFLVGALHEGIRAMFTMMNGARLVVGVQGLGIAEAAYQGAVAYALERLQGRALTGAAHPELPADPIVVHPDVRRMLLTVRAWSEGARAFASWVATELDVAERHPSRERRQQADDLVSLLTPVVKAFLTDLGSECANLGLQVYGGHGYVRDSGMEQLARDARICQIYEGTNGVQAMDLVGRKLSMHTGRYLRRFFHPVSAWLEAHAEDADLGPWVAALAKAFARLQRTTAWIAQAGLRDPNEAGAAATEYLRLFGLVAFGYVWARSAEVAVARLGGGDDGFYRAKLDTARFFFERLLPQSGALMASIMAGAGAITEFDENAFERVA